MSGLVMIAGPYYGDGTEEVIEANIQRARDAAIKLANHSIPFFCPHTHTAHFQRDASQGEEFYRKLAISILKSNAIALYLLPGWENSSGTNAEYQIALGGRIKVFKPFQFDEMVHWYKDKMRGQR